MGMAGAMASMSFYPDGSFRDGQGLRKKFSQAAATAAAASNDEEEAGAAACSQRWEMVLDAKYVGLGPDPGEGDPGLCEWWMASD